MPMTGGARMKIELESRARKYKTRTVEAGYFDAEHATVAAINEYGAQAGPKNGRIPKRPFMAVTIMEKHKSWVANIARMLGFGATSEQALKSTGNVMVVDLRITLRSGRFVKNAERTIKLKGFDYPLYETGRFLGPAIKRRVS